MLVLSLETIRGINIASLVCSAIIGVVCLSKCNMQINYQLQAPFYSKFRQVLVWTPNWIMVYLAIDIADIDTYLDIARAVV